VLAVTISRKFSVTQHVDNVREACDHTLFAQRSLHCDIMVCLKTRYNKLSSLPSCPMTHQLLGDCPVRLIVALSPPFNSICASAIIKLFNNILYNKQYLRFPLLLPEREAHYFLRDILHKFQLPTRSSSSETEIFDANVI
jgi:hypothetical protein